jgi:hypothetical protein
LSSLGTAVNREEWGCWVSREFVKESLNLLKKGEM